MILVFFSGGIDSTGMLIKLLTTSKEPLLVHHCIIPGRRKIPEIRACNKIIEYCKANYRDFEYSTSELILPELPQHAGDMILWSSIGAYMAECDMRITAVARGFSHIYNTPSIGKRKVLDLLYSQALSRKIVQLFPLEGLTKVEVLEIIPEEIRNATWSCRFSEDGETVCGKCTSCVEEMEVREFLSKQL